MRPLPSIKAGHMALFARSRKGRSQRTEEHTDGQVDAKLEGAIELGHLYYTCRVKESQGLGQLDLRGPIGEGPTLTLGAQGALRHARQRADAAAI